MIPPWAIEDNEDHHLADQPQPPTLTQSLTLQALATQEDKNNRGIT